MQLFISMLWEDPNSFFMWIFIVIFSICCHEYMHAQVALWQGDSTAADQGHLTLNPLRQMGLFSLILLAVLGLAWGQVPVNPARMRHKYSDALVSFAGPGTNLALFIIFTIIYALIVIVNKSSSSELISKEVAGTAVGFLEMGATLNFVLFVLNMLPVPGFDGWHVLCSFFPKLKTSDSQFMIFASVVILIIGINYIHYAFLLGRITSNKIAGLLISLA
jgi:Zn-dependent protease